MPGANDVNRFLPLRPLELLVLAMVAERPLHGYGVRQAILDQTAGQVEVEAGNLYRHIRRLDAEGLIESTASGAGEDERRRYFRVTALGRRVLTAELRRLDQLIRFAVDRRIINSIGA